jgi:RNA polymerase I-specific transcription initiation factor RRN6
VDSSGSWSVWEAEGRQNRHSPQKLAPGKRGHILDGRKDEAYLTSSSTKWTDAWHQILWVYDINTIVVCNRRHVAVFDIATRPQRLRSIDFSAAATNDWILDIKKSARNNSHLFVLTTTRILWVKVEPLQEGRNMQPGAKVLLAYQHFREPNDHTMRLTTMEDDKGKSAPILLHGFSDHV